MLTTCSHGSHLQRSGGKRDRACGKLRGGAGCELGLEDYRILADGRVWRTGLMGVIKGMILSEVMPGHSGDNGPSI